MALFKRETSEQKAARDEAAREQAESLAAIEAGRIPVQAQRRLQRQAGTAGFFTSDLSTNEHLLARQAGFEPLGQVMGSSFFRIAFRGYFVGPYQSTGELSPMTQAQLATRALAVSRLKQEAALLGADGVIGVRLTTRAKDWSDHLIELTAIGTAVRYRDHSGAGNKEPFTCALSGEEFWKLHESGYLPKEIAFGVCSYYIHSDYQAGMVLNNFWGAGMANQELRQYTYGFQTARELAMSRFAHEVKRAGAEGAVGVKVDWELEEIEYEVNETSYTDLVVHFAAVGTAIASRAEAARPVPSTLIFYDLKDHASSNLSPKE